MTNEEHEDQLCHFIINNDDTTTTNNDNNIDYKLCILNGYPKCCENHVKSLQLLILC